MPSFRDSIIRLYRTLFTGAESTTTLQQGPRLFLDGNSAVAVCEAAISGYAALGSSYLASGAEIVWRAEEAHPGKTLLGTPLHHHTAEGPRGAFAAAMGLAMAGERATLFMSGRDLIEASSLLTTAVARHLPLVIHVTSEAQAQQGAVLGGGDEALYSAADSGCITLIAGSVQEAIDLTLIGRRIAEQSLTPTVIFMDAEGVAHSGQQVTLPSQTLVTKFVGAPTDTIAVPDAAQRLIFGDERQRVPCWHDLNRPVLHGALQSAESYALGVVGQDLFFTQGLAHSLSQIYQTFEQLSGRRYAPLQTTHTDRAEWLVVTHQTMASQLALQGSAWAKQRVGVVTLCQLHPLPAPQLRQLLQGKRGILILEQQATPSSNTTPLLQRLRAICAEGIPLPPMHCAIHGLGGLSLHDADLNEAVQQWLANRLPPFCYLGLHTTASDSRYPKRQVLLDTLKREYPQLAAMGVHHPQRNGGHGVSSGQQFRLTLHRMADDQRSGLISDIGNLLHHLLAPAADRSVTTQSAIDWELWGQPVVDRLAMGPLPLSMDPQRSADIAVVTNAECLDHALVTLKQHGSLVIAFPLLQVTSYLVRQAEQRQLHLYGVTTAEGEPLESLSDETLLGALFAIIDQHGGQPVKLRQLSKARAAHHAHLPLLSQRQHDEQLQYGFNTVAELLPATLPLQQQVSAPEVPMVVRHLHDRGARYDSLPRFWDQVGSLYRDQVQESQGVDPYLTTGTIPPLTSTFHSHLSMGRKQPHFVATACSGCGLCWANCPDSAIGATALSPKLWLEGMLQQGGIDAIRPMVSKISAQMGLLINHYLRDGYGEVTTLGALFQQALTVVLDKGGIDGERRETMLRAATKIEEHASRLEVAISERLWRQGEAQQKGSGALLSLVINPDSCKGCGICSELCDSQALPMSLLQAEQVRQRRVQWQSWEQLPDTASTTIEQLSGQQLDPLAAKMLSRHCAFSMAGGDGAESGSGAKIALRAILATTEYHQQPLMMQLAEQVGVMHQRVTTEIRALMSPSLPATELEALAEVLEQSDSRQLQWSSLVGQMTANEQDKGVDVVRLQRLITIAKGLSDHRWRLLEGDQGLGRARYSLAIIPGIHTAWAGTYPYNPFQVPTLIDTSGDTLQMAAGLMHSQIRQSSEVSGWMRWADSELKQGASRARDTLRIPSWQQMSSAERATTPPLLLIGCSDELGGRSLAQLMWVLNSGLPIKVVMLNELNLGLESLTSSSIDVAASRHTEGNVAMQALFQGSAYVAQSSIAAPAHLSQSVREMLRHPGPALLQLYVPSPSRHGIDSHQTLQQTQRALAARLLPLFRYDPRQTGVFGSRITLEGNHQPTERWLQAEDGSMLTPVTWALTERRFSNWFRPLEADDGSPLTVVDYLALDNKGRKRHCATVSSTEAESTPLRIAPELLRIVEQTEQQWRTLQELAGLVTPFTQQVEQAAEQRLRQGHQAEMAQLQQQHESQIAALQAQIHQQTADQIRDRLMNLAGYQTPTTPPQL